MWIQPPFVAGGHESDTRETLKAASGGQRICRAEGAERNLWWRLIPRSACS